MKNAAKQAVLASAIALSCSALHAQSNDYDDRWYATVFGGLAELDGDRAGVRNDAVVGIGIGRFVTEHLSFDLEFDRIDSELNPPPGFFVTDFNAKSLGIFGRWHLNGEDNDIRPYIGFGGGGTFRHAFDGGISGDKDVEIFLSPIVGLSFDLGDHFGARLQAAYRTDLGNDTDIGENRYDDFLFTAGLTYKFGAPPAPPPPPPAPAAAPPPPPPVDGDDDNDGVRNSRDKCPNTRPGAVVDMDGCEVQVIIDLPGVNFAFDEARLTDESFAILNDAVDTLKRHRQVKIEVAGHTDSVGTETYNLGLSDRRAAVVRDYLISQGIAADRMTSNGYGESRPVATNDTREGRAQNRRTELVITSK